MTKTEAKTALRDRLLVEGGEPGTDDYGAGYIIEIDGDVATVAWRDGVRTPCHIDGLVVV